MKVFKDKGKGVNAIYPKMAEYILKNGALVETEWHGKPEYAPDFTLEVNPAIMQITNPRRRLVTSRDQNVAFLLAEVLWIMSGRRDVEMLAFYNSNMANFSDDGEVFNASYGYRMRNWNGFFDQIADVVKTLVDNPYSRQATIVISDPDHDHGYMLGEKNTTKDRACNLVSHLLVRDGKLNWLQVLRSNDLIWGTPTNWMQWTHMQEWIANMLEVEVGTFTMVSDSLHIYQNMMDEARKVADSKGQPDLYDLVDTELATGSTHHSFEATDTHIQDLREVEAAIRTGNAATNWPMLMSVPQCWTPIMFILEAHYQYKCLHDHDALHKLAAASVYEPVYGIAQARFYWVNRWSKGPTVGGADHQVDRKDLKTIWGKPIADWITR